MNPQRYLIPIELLKSEELLAQWSWLLTEKYHPVCFTIFGDWFLENQYGEIYWLDSAFGELNSVAQSKQDFWMGLQTQEAFDEWLMAELAELAFERNVIPKQDECLGFKTPVVLGAKLAVENLQVFDIFVHQSIHSQIHQQLKK